MILLFYCYFLCIDLDFEKKKMIFDHMTANEKLIQDAEDKRQKLEELNRYIKIT